MPTSSDINIVQDYVSHLNRICNLVISDCHICALEGTQPNRYIITRYQNKALLPIALKPKGCLDFYQEVSVSKGGIIVENYVYRYSPLYTQDKEPQWVLRYEYNRSPVEYIPHAHLHIIANRGGKFLGRIHFPTGGRVSIEQIIAHLIFEYGVTPKCEDWFEILSKSHQGFLEKRGEPPAFF